jgi:selenocysteine-specific elongation factor
MRIFATAGHVDHGKSSLVTALTGTNPDRWREERERGMTIDLGFAHFTLPSGREVSLIDVPGHIRFINNMLAGVGGIHGAILVVDAHEGWMPQTEEHLRILELAGTRHGVVKPNSRPSTSPTTWWGRSWRRLRSSRCRPCAEMVSTTSGANST